MALRGMVWWFAAWTAFIAGATACSDGSKAEPVLIDAPPDAAPAVNAEPKDAGRGPERLGPCGDVTPADNHPPFEAIRRLATTHDEVRILVYGQSISAQDWWLEVRDWLKKTYPNGNLVMENHSKGACSSDCLVGRDSWFTDGRTENRLPADVFGWKPDLILFNVYGPEDDYEYVAHGFVEGCSAFDKHPVATAHCRPGETYPGYRKPEVLLQTDHRLEGTYPDVDPNLGYHNEVFIPGLAKTLGVSWSALWWEWAAYLDDHGRDPKLLLADSLHLNDRGNAVMAAIIKRDLCYRPLQP